MGCTGFGTSEGFGSVGLLFEANWTRKEMRRIYMDRSDSSQTLRRVYLDDIRQFVAEDFIFFDESTYNEKTDWRHHGMCLSAMRRDTMLIYDAGEPGICAAMTLNGWLPCTGYLSSDGFF
jgi:hypothetical protein